MFGRKHRCSTGKNGDFHHVRIQDFPETPGVDVRCFSLFRYATPSRLQWNFGRCNRIFWQTLHRVDFLRLEKIKQQSSIFGGPERFRSGGQNKNPRILESCAVAKLVFHQLYIPLKPACPWPKKWYTRLSRKVELDLLDSEAFLRYLNSLSKYLIVCFFSTRKFRGNLRWSVSICRKFTHLGIYPSETQ